MIYFVLLIYLLGFLAAFAIELIATYFLIKLFNRTISFRLAIKPILLYELGVFCLFIVKPALNVLSRFVPNLLSLQLSFLISVAILFIIFSFIMKKFSILDFKKSLIVFLIIFILAPILGYSVGIFERFLMAKFPIFQDINFYKNIPTLYSLLSPKSLPEILLYKINTLNDIFLGGDFMNQLREIMLRMPTQGI